MSARAEFVAVIGAPGSGKSLYIKSRLARLKPRRLLIWDAMAEYGAHAERVGELASLVKLTEAQNFRARYVCSNVPARRALQFEAFCVLAYRRGGLVLVVDEMGDVTTATPSLVPAGWSVVCRKGRHRGLSVIGGVQRPALVDKNFFSFATLIHCGRLNYADDVRTMDNVLGLAGRSVGELLPLAWIERDMTTGKTRAGVIAAPGRQKKDSLPLP